MIGARARRPLCRGDSSLDTGGSAAKAGNGLAGTIGGVIGMGRVSDGSGPSDGGTVAGA